MCDWEGLGTHGGSSDLLSCARTARWLGVWAWTAPPHVQPTRLFAQAHGPDHVGIC